MSKSIAIIGSGFLGLTLALRYAKAGTSVTVFESASEIGGLASAWQIGDIVWDKHYHVTLFSDSHTRGIVSEIGLGDDFNWVETKTGFYADSKLYSLSNSLEFLRFPPLGLIDKFRLGGTIFYASKVKNWQKLEQTSVEVWLRRLSGNRTFEKIWRPLLKAKLGQAYSQTSAAFIWATIQRMYAARNSGMKKELFGYVRGGYSKVLSEFERVLKEIGVDIRLDAKAVSIERQSDGMVAVTSAENDGKQVSRFDQVILTCPPAIAAGIVKQLTDREKERLAGIQYQGIVCASVLLRKPLSPYYVTNIIDETPFTGIIDMSALVDSSDLKGKGLVYLPKYVSPDDELFQHSDEEIKEIFLSELDKMYPDFSMLDVLAFKVSRVKQVFPVPVLNYSQKVPEVKTSVENVFIVNSAHIFNGTLNVNETIQLAESFYSNANGKS